MNLFRKSYEIVINSNTYVITNSKISEGSFGYIKFGKKKGDPSDNLAFKFLKVNSQIDIDTAFNFETVLFNELTEKINDGCKKYIVKLIDSGKVNNKYIIVMEKPDGFISIRDYINQKKDNSQDTVEQIYKNLLKGIYCINCTGFTHCDIKPENVMVHPDTKEIKYIDFGGLIKDGSACIIHTKGYSATHGANGTIQPYHYDETYYNGAGDLYAIGIIVKSLVTNATNINIEIDLLVSTKFKEKVMMLQDFYRSTYDDEYIEIGELKKDSKETFFLNKNGYKTFIRETTGDIKEQLNKSGFSELYY